MDNPVAGAAGEARQVGIMDMKTGSVQVLSLPATCWHVAVHEREEIFYAISSEESRFQLSGALLQQLEDTLALVATDGHRLALVESEVPGIVEAEGVLVPRKALQELLMPMRISSPFSVDGSDSFEAPKYPLMWAQN